MTETTTTPEDTVEQTTHRQMAVDAVETTRRQMAVDAVENYFYGLDPDALTDGFLIEDYLWHVEDLLDEAAFAIRAAVLEDTPETSDVS
jgi:hypothetical protein